MNKITLLKQKTMILHCPKCKNKMKYQSQTRLLKDKRKTCVYCGRNFKVLGNILK